MTIFEVVDDFLSSGGDIEPEHYDFHIAPGNRIDWKATTHSMTLDLGIDVYEIVSRAGEKRFLRVYCGDVGICEGYKWFQSLDEAMALETDDHRWEIL